METVQYHHVITLAAAKCGFALSGLAAPQLARLRGLLYSRTKEYWRAAWWSQLMLAEERFYRADYNGATAYATGDQVYYATTGYYYEALQSTTGNAPTNATYWERITGDDFSAYIDLAQAGETEIGDIRLVSVDDPLETHDPRPQPFRLLGDRLYVLGEDVPDSVYVWFRRRMPMFLGDTFDANTVYTAGKIVYYAGSGASYLGDWWECEATTTAGQDPEDTPAKWTRLEFPHFLMECVAHGAYADYLRADAQRELAAVEEREAARLLYLAITRDGVAQRQLLRAAGA